MDTDDLEPPPRPANAPRDLSVLGIGELEAYILSLDAEIARAREAIARKKAHQAASAAFFGGSFPTDEK